MQPSRTTKQCAQRWPLLALLTACGSPGEIVVSIPPESRSAQSFILAHGEQLQAFGDGALRFDIEATDSESLLLLAYASSLADLGLTEGEQASGVTCRPCELLHPIRAHQALLENEKVGPWSEAQNAPASVLDRLVPDSTRCAQCPKLEGHPVPADRTEPLSPITLITPYEGEAIVMYDDGHIRRISPAHDAEQDGWVPDELCEASGSFAPRGGYRATESLLFVSDASRRISVLDLNMLRPDRPCEQALVRTVTVAPVALDVLDGPKDPDPAELYGLASPLLSGGDYTIMFRYTPEEGWVEVGRLQGTDNDPDLAWSEPGVALGVNGNTEYLRTSNGRGDLRSIEADGSELFAGTVEYISPWGYLLGTNNSLLVVERGDRFEFLADVGAPAQRTTAVSSYQGALGPGLAIATREGGLRFYFEGSGYCDGYFAFGPSSANHESPDEILVEASGNIIGGSSRPFYALAPDTGCAP